MTAANTASTNGLVPYTRDNASPAPAAGGMLMPLANASQAAEAINAYETLKTAIVRPEQDVQIIQGRKFLKKSFWRRVAACFGLSLELVSEERLILDGKLAYRATYRAVAPNGRTMDGDGMCSNAEKGREAWPEHNVRATAHTRAKNRAISDIVGGGEVSAEEMPDDDDDDGGEQGQRPQRQASAQAQQPADRAAAAMRNKDVMDLLVQRQCFNDRDRRLELDSVFAAIESAGATVNAKSVKTELQQRLADAVELSGLDMGMPGN